MELSLPKGTRDFAPDEKILRDKVVFTLKEVFELYGFAPLETPVFEKFDVLSSKYTGGAEILKETFKLKDQGNRDLGLRYDLTVPLSRFVGMNPNLKMPFKRYQMGEVFRDGPVSVGRYRQFTQCDVDIIGSNSLASDVEIMSLIDFAFKKFGLDSVIRFNSRKLLNDMLNYCGIEKSRQESVILSLDKLEKFGAPSVKSELVTQGIDEMKITKILGIAGIKGTNEEKIRQIKVLLKESEGVLEIEKILELLEKFSLNAEFDASLARGLSYYTGTVIETFLKNSGIKSSVCSGGRYDNMIGSLLEKESVPAMGVSFGVDRIYDAMLEKNDEKPKTTVKVYVIPIKTVDESLEIVKKLRDSGINTDIDLIGKGPSKNLDYANALKIPYVLFVGKKELEEGKFKLRDMKSGKEEMVEFETIKRKLEN
ncbi:MAG TPA: histidine--tRNA ligase [Candidatus Nanoarchaeia archaeon]|nr:histidine--tRNA ligase [Candidatus Nanoarchaeia archaeon]